MVGVELSQRSNRAVAEVLCVAEEEVELVTDHQRQQVGGPPAEEVVEP